MYTQMIYVFKGFFALFIPLNQQQTIWQTKAKSGDSRNAMYIVQVFLLFLRRSTLPGVTSSAYMMPCHGWAPEAFNRL